MKRTYRYVLNRPWFSSGSNGIIEDYVSDLVDVGIKNKYNLVQRVSSILGLNKSIIKEKEDTYFKTIDTFCETVSSFDEVDISFYNQCADSIDIRATSVSRAYKKLKSFNRKLNSNLSKSLDKRNLNLYLDGEWKN